MQIQDQDDIIKANLLHIHNKIFQFDRENSAALNESMPSEIRRKETCGNREPGALDLGNEYLT